MAEMKAASLVEASVEMLAPSLVGETLMDCSSGDVMDA